MYPDRQRSYRSFPSRKSGRLPSCCHCTEEPPIWQGLPAQKPGNASGSALCRVIVVVAWVYLKHCVDPLILIERPDLLRVLPDISQDRVPGLVLLVPKGEVDAVRLAFGLMGEDVLLHARKPERTGHAAYTGKQIRPVDGIQGKQPRQRIPGNPPPTRSAGYFLLCRWDDLLGQQLQIAIRAASAGLGIFEGGWAVPGYHVVVPVQITDGHQSKRRTASDLCRLKYLLSLSREGVEVNDWGSRFGACKDTYCLFLHNKRFHPNSPHYYFEV